MREATGKGYLRQNTVDRVTGKNTGTNWGPVAGIPLAPAAQADVDVRLMLKGGGCENIGRPVFAAASRARADRDLEGRAQGSSSTRLARPRARAAAPASSASASAATGHRLRYAKEQLLRELDDTNPTRCWRHLEARIIDEANKLGIGPMGFGGKTTVCDVQDRRAQPLAGVILRLAWPTCAGRTGGGARIWMQRAM